MLQIINFIKKYIEINNEAVNIINKSIYFFEFLG